MTTKAYWIGRVEVTNMDAYKNYVALNGAAFSTDLLTMSPVRSSPTSLALGYLLTRNGWLSMRFG